jgi:glycosyltransferase involved in cell wall biosynthesis
MAAFNHAAYIEEAISSALAQTWADFELIVVDDGSTDDTARKVRTYGAPVRYIRQENSGQGAARNRGITNARGEFISFLDDDDLWEPGYLATTVSLMDQQPDIAAVYTGFQIIDGEGRRLPQRSSPVVPPGKMYFALLQGGWFPPAVVTVRKACLDQVGPLDESLRGHDDWDLWLRISRNHVFRGIPDVLANYRVHAGGLSDDIDHMLEDQKQAVSKHFGPDVGAPDSWPDDKRRAYAFAYRTVALGYIGRGDTDEGWGQLRHAVEVEPGLLARLDTFYELALGDQPRGYRGDSMTFDTELSHRELQRRLDSLFASVAPPLQAHKDVAFGNTYLALAMLSDQAGQWNAARRYMRRAIRSHWPLLRDQSVVRRMIKLYMGRRVVGSLRRLGRGPGAGVMD